MNTGFRVVRVSDDLITMKSKSLGEEVSVPYGIAVWSAGIGTRPVIMDFMQQIGQVVESHFKPSLPAYPFMSYSKMTCLQSFVNVSPNLSLNRLTAVPWQLMNG